MKRAVIAVLLVVGLATAAAAQQPTGLQVEDLFKLKRVSDPQVSPDGKAVVYVVTSYDRDKNNRNNQI
jgi:hypothetical protein